MPVRYTPPDPRICCRLLACGLGTAAAKIKNWQRDDRAAGRVRRRHRRRPACSRRTASAAAPVRGVPPAISPGRRRPRARCQRGQRQRGHRRARHRRRAEATLRGRRVDARLRAAAGASVLDRRHHGAAARRARSSRALPVAHAALAPDHWLRRRVGDHDDRHRAEGRVAPRSPSTACRSRSPASRRAPG